MRRGSQDKQIITSKIVETAEGHKSGGQVLGINLGRDSVAEHEHGIRGLWSAFGFSGEPKRRKGFARLCLRDLVGVNVRTVTKVPAGLMFFEDLDGYAYLIFSSLLSWKQTSGLNATTFDSMLHARDNEELSTAWSDDDFGIRMKNGVLQSGSTVLGQIYEAFKKRDMVVFLGGQKNPNPFSGSGLILAIRSRMPEDALKHMREVDEDRLNLAEAVEKTGIKEKLKAAGKQYYALSPRWASNIKSTKDNGLQTNYPVIFWLSPRKQLEDNCGWFTVEQLLEWIDGSGPIPKK